MNGLEIVNKEQRCFDEYNGDELLYVKIEPELLRGAEMLPTCEFGAAYDSKTIGELLDDIHFPAACVNIENSYSAEARDIQIEDIRFLLVSKPYAVTDICDAEHFKGNSTMRELVKAVKEAVEDYLDSQPVINPEIMLPDGERVTLINGDDSLNVELKNDNFQFAANVYATPDGNVRIVYEEEIIDEDGNTQSYDGSEIMSPQEATQKFKDIAAQYDIEKPSKKSDKQNNLELL